MITVNKSPYNYNPAYNPNIWVLESDNTSLQYFLISIMDGANTVFTGKFYATPDYSTGVYFDISAVLRNLVKWEISGTDFSEEVDKPLKSYTLEITEKVESGGSIVDGDSKTTDAFNIWNAGIPNYYPSDWVASTGNIVHFLTDKPNYSVVNEYSRELLYYLTEISTKAVIKTYDTGRNLLSTYTGDTATANHIYKLEVSPKELSLSLQVDFDNVAYYTVELIDANSNTVSEVRTYLCYSLGCGLTPVNLLWVNQYGGIDSYQFHNPIEDISVQRDTIKHNTYKMDATGNYTNLSGYLYNTENEIIDREVSTKYTVSSAGLSDKQADWLKSLIKSKQVFVELNDKNILPVVLNTSSYTVTLQRYIRTALNVAQVQFITSLDGANVVADTTNNLALIDVNENLLINNDNNLILS